jgi:hypothetical protein
MFSWEKIMARKPKIDLTKPVSSSETKSSRSPTLVNRYLNHPQGAYRWHKIYDPSICEHVPGLYEGGKSDAEVAVAIGVAKQTLYRWMNEYPEFKEAVQYGRNIAETVFQEAGRKAALGHNKDVNHVCWLANMRNRFDFDITKKTDDTNDAPDESEIRKVAEEKLESKLSDY